MAERATAQAPSAGLGLQTPPIQPPCWSFSCQGDSGQTLSATFAPEETIQGLLGQNPSSGAGPRATAPRLFLRAAFPTTPSRSS